MERIRTYLFFVLLFPLAMFAEVRNDLFSDLATSVEEGDYNRSLDFAYEWVCEEPTLHSQACLSLFLLINKRVDDAQTIYFNIIDHIEEELSPELGGTYTKLFLSIAEQGTLSLDDFPCNFNYTYDCKFRGWKFKNILGAVLFTAGLFVAPFHPAAGKDIMIVAAGIILDGTLNYKDEADDKKDREDPPSKETSCKPEALVPQFKLLSRNRLYKSGPCY